jgi:hypothetical protein
MSNSIDEKVKAYSRGPRLQAFDINATFGNGQPGRIEKRLMDDSGRCLLDTQAWEAGEVAYQCLTQLFPNGISEIEFLRVADEFYSLACDDLYPIILSKAEAGKIVIEPNGVEGLKAAWAEYDWCQRVMFVFDFTEKATALGADFDNPLNTVLPLVLLQRLNEAVIADLFDGRGLSEVMLEIASLRDRLKPPEHVVRAINIATKSARRMQAKLGAQAKLANDPKQEDKAKVRECWDAWQKNPLNPDGTKKYKDKSAFALDMVTTWDHLKRTRTVTDWCLDWEREAKKEAS